MRALQAQQIRGTWATVLTPFREDDGLDLGALDAELEVLVDAEPEGIYTHGTAGEFFNQTEDEWFAVASAVARRAEQAGLPFQIGASHPGPVMALERLRRARALEPSALQVILPDWFRLSENEIRAVLERYSAAADGVGLVLYNPPHAKNVLSAPQLDAFTAEFPSIVGVKTADGGEDWYVSMTAVMARVSVFVPGHHLATGLARGALGAYSNVACLHPAGAVEWGRRSLEDPSWGADVERRIAVFLDDAVAPLVRKGYANVTLDKALAAAGGHLGDAWRVRWPHATATPAEVARLREAAFRLLPDLLHPARRGGPGPRAQAQAQVRPASTGSTRQA